MSFTRDREGVIELLRKHRFLCEQAVVTETFGLNPGVFDIKRMPKGDFYKRHTFELASGFKPKTIFVADPTLSKDPYISLRNIVSEFLKVLMRDYGFIVYTWKNGPKKIKHCDAVYDDLKTSTPVELDDVLALNICPASNLQILHFYKIRSVIPQLFIDLYGSDYPLSVQIFTQDFLRNNYVIPQLFRDLQEDEISTFVKAIRSYDPEQAFPVMFETCMVDDIHNVISLLVGMPSLNVRVQDTDFNTSRLVFEVMQRCNLNAVTVADMTFNHNLRYMADEEFWKYLPNNIKELTLYLEWYSFYTDKIQKIYDKCEDLTVLNLGLNDKVLNTTDLAYAKSLVPKNPPNRAVAVNIKNRESFEYDENPLHAEIADSLNYFFQKLAKISDTIDAEPNKKKKPKAFYDEIDKEIKCLIAESGLKEYFAKTSYLYLPGKLDALTILMLVYNCECLNELVVEGLVCSDGSMAGINVYFAEVNENIDPCTISSVVVLDYDAEFDDEDKDNAENLYAFLFRLSGQVTSFDLNPGDFIRGSKLIYDLLENIGPGMIRIDSALPAQFLEELRLTYPKLLIFGYASKKQLKINRTKILSELVEESPNCDKMAARVSLANLAPGSKNLYARTYFLPKDIGKYPVPEYYRLSVVVPIQVNIIPVKFPGHNQPEQLYAELKDSADDVFYCKKALTLKYKWQAIPSASLKEELLSFSCSSKKPILLGRSAEKKLYYVRLAEHEKEDEYDHVADLSEPATIEFVVKAKLENLVILKPEEHAPGLTEKFRQLRFHHDGSLVKNKAFDDLSDVNHETLVSEAILFFKRFTGKKITDSSIYAGLKKYELINFCIKNMVGACAVRTNICYILLQKFGVDPSLFSAVKNNTHAFIGYKDNEYCLGGAPAVVKKQEMQLSVSACINNIEVNVQKQETIKEKMRDNPFVVSHQRKSVTISQADDLYHLLDEIAFKKVKRRQQIWVINDDKEGDQLESVLRDISKKSAQFSLEFISDLTNPTFTRDFITDGADVLEEDSELTKCIKSGRQGACILIRDPKFPPPSIINVLFDPEQRRLDDVQIPAAISIILILKKDQIRDCGSDLLSRVAAVYNIDWNLDVDPYANLLCSEDVKQVKKAIHTMTVYEDTENDFMRKLLGGPTLEDKFQYETGELVKAIDGGKSLCIINPPETSIKYNEFLRELACHRLFRINGVDVKIPDDFRIYHTREPYNVSHEYRVIATDIIPNQCTEILTQAKFLFYVYKDYRADKLMPVPIDTVIKQYENLTLHLYVSEILPHAKWAELITLARQNACQLVIYTPVALDLPSEMSDRREYGIDFSAHLHARPKQLTVMTCSHDTEFAASVFAATYDEGSVVRIKIDKETNYADITGRIVRVPESNRAVRFVQSEILTLLETNYTVILYGDEISSELYGHLQSLLLNNAHLYVNGEKRTITGRIYLLLPDSKKLSYVANPDYVINSSLDAYRQHLIATTYLNEALYVEFAMRLIQAFLVGVPSFHFNYMKFKHVVEYLIHLPSHNPLLPLLHADSKTEEIDAAKEVWLSFKTQRPKPDENNGIEIKNHLINKILYRLNRLGFVCLVGETGTCKSAIIDELKRHYQLFYKGIEYLHEWLENGGVLVVDEANTLPSKLQRLLMGFFTEHQVVTFAGKYYQIKRDTHRLILAGNQSYYQGRGQSALFETGTVLFKSAKHAYLRDVVVAPLLSTSCNRIVKEINLPLANIILSAYDRANSKLPKHLKLTPRNLRMISLRFLTLLDMRDRFQFSHSPDKCLKLAVYLELKPLLAMEEANRLHPSITLAVDSITIDTYYSNLRQSMGSYIQQLTPTQEKIAYDLFGQIMIYQMCQRHPNLRSVPISGIKVMGMPGTGKSMLLNGILNALGYKQFDLDMNDPTIAERLKNTNYFIYGKTGKPDLLNEQILFAEKYGLVMIIDEVNAIPRPDMPDVKSTESLLNRAMSDGNDEVRESGAGHSLFLTTANPPGRFANREEISAALNNRFLSLECTPPDRKDLIYLAESHGLCMQQAYEVAAMYLEALSALNKEGNNALTLRTFTDYLFAVNKKRPLELDVLSGQATVAKRQKLA